MDRNFVLDSNILIFCHRQVYPFEIAHRIFRKACTKNVAFLVSWVIIILMKNLKEVFNEEILLGIFWCRGIAERFMAGLVQVPDAYLAAVSSSTYERAKSFADKYNAKVYRTVEELIADENVDIIYVATPNTVHKENTLMALNMGKPVLCEKPMAPNAEMVREMVNFAREKKVYLMEAMWTRFFPAIRKALTWIEEGRIGKVQFVTADFGYYEKEDPSLIIFNPETAGGSLLDVGIYPLAFAFMVFGKKPNRITGLADMTSTVWMQLWAVHWGLKAAVCTAVFSYEYRYPQEAEIIGEKDE